MSLFYWNSYVERRNAAAMVNAMNNALLMDYESSSSSILSMSSLSSGSMTNDDMSIASAGHSNTSNSSDEFMCYLQLSGTSTVRDCFCVCFVLTFVRRLRRGFLGSENQRSPVS